MDNLDSISAPLVTGIAYNVYRDLVNLDVEETITNGWLTIKADAFSDLYIIQKHVTLAEVPDTGQVFARDSLGAMQLLFHLTAAETKQLDPYTDYRYWIEVETATGNRFMRECGRLVPKLGAEYAEPTTPTGS